MFQQIWSCNLCKKKQDILAKTGQWYHGGMAKPVGLDVDTGSDASSIKTDTSPPHEKKPKFPDGPHMQHLDRDSGQSSEKENIAQNVPPGGARGPDGRHMSRQMSHGKELRRQYSMTDAVGSRPGQQQPQQQQQQQPDVGPDHQLTERKLRHTQERLLLEERGQAAYPPPDLHKPTDPRDRDRDRDRDRERHSAGGWPPYSGEANEQYPRDQRDRFGDERRHGEMSPGDPRGSRSPGDRGPPPPRDPHDPRAGGARGERAQDNRSYPSSREVTSPRSGDERNRERPASRERYNSREDLKRREDTRHR